MALINDRTAYPLNGTNAKEFIELTSGYINAQSGTSYTLQESDWGVDVEMSNASANAVTVPSTLPDGFWCTIIQVGGGATTIIAGSGATVNSYSSQYTLAGQFADCIVRRRASAGVYRICGNLIP